MTAPPTTEPADGTPHADKPAADEPTADEPTADARSADERAVDERAADERAADERAVDERAAGERAADEPAADEPAADEPAVDERAADEPAADERAADEPAVGARPADERAADERAADEPAADEPAVDERAADEPAADEPAVDERAVGARPADERAADERAVDERAVDERAVDGRAVGERPPGARLGDESTVGGRARGAAAPHPLLVRLAALRDRTAALVERRAAHDPTADDPLRGLYVSGDEVRRLLHAPRVVADDETDGAVLAPDPIDPTDRLSALAARLRLADLDAAILLIALAPDLDRGFETLYGYLNDDVGRRRATVGLALDLCGLSTADAAARDRFHPTAPLTWLGLLRVEERDAPFLSRPLRVPDRLIAHLAGDDTPDAALDGRVRPLPVRAVPRTTGSSLTGRLADLLDAPEPPLVYLRERRDGDGLACAIAALADAGIPALHLHSAPGPHQAADDPAPIAELLLEARLRDCAIVVSPVPERPAELVRRLAAADVPVILAGPGAYDPRWCDADPVILDAPRLRSGAVDQWKAALGLDPGFDLAGTVAAYRLSGERIVRAARSALELAAFDGTELTAAHVRQAARQQSAFGLELHARRIVPDVGWNDLVLPQVPLEQLHELALRARHRDRVLGEWRLSAGGGRGRGVLAMFAGESGTGKTLSAEVVAADLGLDLYVVQLSSVVDKYVGETEKNLERIFTEADRTDAVLLFDEADAVFGKRSEVKDSHDRYANLESAYLLQRLEAFDGIALLTTNLRANIDEAFTRRLDLVIDFPFPDEEQRRALWRHSLAHVPCADDLDPSACARDFELAGGSIRSAVVTAAYAAAGRGGRVTTHDLLDGARREYRKSGRLVMADVGW
ncbi:AAA family ATPase [Spirillospora sp. CA-294931]|uniref:ATP-binding protein n=1 Tax=Spirillospora sp. CA-294931 TaxID=3240042 RepID=UPI003D8E7C2E